MKWDSSDADEACECGKRQTYAHLLQCTMSPAQCTSKNIHFLEVVTYHLKYIIMTLQYYMWFLFIKFTEFVLHNLFI